MQLPWIHQVDVAMTRRGHLRGRRDFLRNVATGSLAAGSLGAGMLSFPDLLRAEAATMKKNNKACILLWMQGGPSQFETFSPLSGHANGGETKATSTSVPGVEIAENLPEIAKVMDHLAVIRSMTSREGNHQRATSLLHTGYLPTPTVRHPNLGAHVAHHLADAAAELPSFVRVGNLRTGGGGGLLGVEYDPFVVRNAKEPPQHSKPTTSKDRYRRRLALMQKLEKGYAESGAKREVADHQKLYRKASRMILSQDMKAFDLTQEPEAVRAAYGEGQFAAGCLLARRLIESGVTFVEVVARGWDTHADNFEKCRDLCGKIDRPTAALLRDLAARGRLDDTLVIWMGEFGRTPKINGRGGRDHFPRAFNVAMAGSGIKGGKVIGAVSDNGKEVTERPVTVPDLFRSYCQALGIDPDYENMSPIGRPITIADKGQAVAELFS